MEPEAFLDAFARDQQAGLGALARLSRPGDWDPPGDPPWDPREHGDWDPPLAGGGDPPSAGWDAGDWPPAEEPDLPNVAYRSLGPWS